MRFDIIKRFVTDSARKGGIACDYHDILVTPPQVPPDGHAERCGKRRACVARTVAIMFALGAQKKTVEPAELAHCVKTIEPPGKHFVYVALVAYVHDETIPRRVKHAVQRNGQLDNAEIRAEMATGLRENFDQLIAHFLSELRQILFTKRSDVGWGTDSIEQTLRRVCCLGGLRIFRRV
jgi:hypothetical protein